MKIRVQAVLFFDPKDEAEAEKFYDAVSAIKAKLHDIVTPSLKSNEHSHISIQRCYHDEDPTRPCEEIKRIDTADEVKK